MNDPQPGDRQQRDNKAFKDAAGSAPNGVANKFLNMLRGKRIRVATDTSVIVGTLIQFDAYSLVVHDEDDEDASPILVFKGPGIAVTAARNDSSDFG